MATVQPKAVRLAIQRFSARSNVQFWSLLGIVLLGLVLRLYAAWDWNSYHPDSSQRLIGDEPGYDNVARELLQGLGITWPGRVPLYPLWLAGIYLFAGGSYNAVAYVQSLLGVATIILTYALGYRAFGHTTGLIAAFFTAISYVLIHQSLHLLSEVLYTPAILLITIALWDALRNPSAGRFAWLALWIGISNLIRPTLFLFPLALIVILLIALGRRQALRYWIVCVLVASLVIAPWMVRNFIRYQAIFPLATSNAILWQGSPEYYHLIHDHGFTYYKIWAEVLYKPGNEAIDPTSIAGDRFWTKRALRSIADEPLVYLNFALEKAGTYWVGDPNADWGDTYVFNYDALLRIGFTPFDAVLYTIARLIPIFALVAGIALRRRWRMLLPIYALLGYCTLLHAATHAEARLSDPLQPLLFVLIAGAMATVYRDKTAMKRLMKSTIKRSPYIHRMLLERERLRSEANQLRIDVEQIQHEARQAVVQADQLRAELDLVRSERDKILFGWPPGHFYSPIPNLEEIKRKEEFIFRIPTDLPGVKLNIDQQLTLFNEIKKFYPEQPFGDDKKEGLRYFFQNPNYSYGESLVLYGMMRHLRPKKIIEVGSGYSSCVILDTNEFFLENTIQCTFIEPNPDLLRSLIKSSDADMIDLVPKDLQDINIDVFRELSKNDILFLDSTHVSKVNSDVNYIFFEILPHIKSGVYIHFHDICYPFEYPKQWIYQGRAWNEAYILRAFLQYNEAFAIQFFNSYLGYFYNNIFSAEMPLYATNPGTSLWMKKV